MYGRLAQLYAIVDEWQRDISALRREKEGGRGTAAAPVSKLFTIPTRCEALTINNLCASLLVNCTTRRCPFLPPIDGVHLSMNSARTKRCASIVTSVTFIGTEGESVRLGVFLAVKAQTLPRKECARFPNGRARCCRIGI